MLSLAKPVTLKIGRLCDGSAVGESLNAELLEDALSGEIRTAGGDENDHAGADFIEEVGTNGENIAGGPEVDAALIVGRADGGRGQSGAGAGDIVIVLAVFEAQEDAVAVGEVVIEFDLFGAVDFGSGEGGAIVRRGERGRAEVGQGKQEILRFEGLGSEERRGNRIPDEGIDAGVRDF